jgi:hypothetical protein
MDYQKIELHIAQVERLITATKGKVYTGDKKLIYDNFVALFRGIKASQYKTFQLPNMEITKEGLDIVFYGIEHLSCDEPKELVYLLQRVLDDWLPGISSDYHVVVSYNNTANDFLHRGYTEERWRGLKGNFAILFKVNFTNALVQISKPRFLIDDFLGSVPVYHELGHFIFNNYNLFGDLYRDKTFYPGKLLS